MNSTESAGVARAPVPKQRILGPDLSRGAMLLLIAMAYAGFQSGSEFGASVVDHPVLDQIAAFATTLLLKSRALPMFAILFGYGLVWMVSRRTARGADPDEVRRQIRRRGLFLLLFGAVHALLVYPPEILRPYGIALLITGWLLWRSNRTLVVTASILAGFYAVTITSAMIAMSSARAAGELDISIAGYATLADWVDRATNVPVSAVGSLITAPVLLYVVLGYYAGRLGLLDDPAAHRTTLARIAVVGIAVSVAGATPAALMTVGAIQPDTLSAGLLLALQILTGVFGGAGYAAVFALLSIRLSRSRGPVTRAVSAVGQRSLTFYLANSVVLALLLHPGLLGLPVGEFGALVAACCVWLVGLVTAAWLDRTGRPGPLDALMRRLVNR